DRRREYDVHQRICVLQSQRRGVARVRHAGLNKELVRSLGSDPRCNTLLDTPADGHFVGAMRMEEQLYLIPDLPKLLFTGS
ncbi:MAG: hypothetical protein ACE1Y4_15600, partial [Lysobacterales bacterium]